MSPAHVTAAAIACASTALHPRPWRRMIQLRSCAFTFHQPKNLGAGRDNAHPLKVPQQQHDSQQIKQQQTKMEGDSEVSLY